MKKLKRRLSRRWKVQKIRQAATYHRKKFARKARNLWMEETCSGSRIQCVHARVPTCACFPFFLIGFRESQRRQWSTLSTTGYLDESSVSVLPTGLPSSFPSPSSSVPCTPGDSADLFKRRSRRDAQLPASSMPATAARFFSHPRFFVSIFILDSCPRRYMCQFVFLVIQSDSLYLVC